jgi:hypothetical protein
MLAWEARGLLFGVVVSLPPPLLLLRFSLSNSKLRPPLERRLIAVPSMPSVPKLGESTIVLALVFDT